MKIISDRLILKEITWEDLGFIHELHSIPEIDEYNTLGIPKNVDETKEVIRPDIEDQKSDKRKKYCWIVSTIKTNENIGLAGMSLSADRFNYGELYYKIIPEQWGNGYATEVTKALIKFGFKTLKLHRIIAGVQTENTRSRRVLEKAGMTREGRHKKILPIRGEWKDNYHYAIVEDEYVENL
ncbi:MAG: GNAT family N-acetyltransferase [Bacteroidales bacterium]|nr:GNAT family N-acetyltransferase [Bacteroidales bacterium]